MNGENDFRKVTVSFIVRAKDVDRVVSELQELPYGVYHMGCETKELKRWEWNEVKEQVPSDILNEVNPVLPESICDDGSIAK